MRILSRNRAIDDRRGKDGTEALFFLVIFLGVFLQSNVGFGTAVTVPPVILLASGVVLLISNV